MFKQFSFALLAVLSVGCVNSETTRITESTSLHYSAYFKLAIPTSSLAGAKILPSAGPLIKFSDSVMMGGEITTREQDELPEDFNLSLYPRYLLGLEPTDLLPEDLRWSFDNSLSAFGVTPAAVVTETPYGQGTVYSACDAPSCLVFVVQHAQDEQILMLNTKGFGLADILAFLEGSDVK